MALTAIGYALLFASLIRSKRYGLVPFFTLYIAAMVPAVALWNPNNATSLFIAGAILMILRICVAIEAFLLVSTWLALSERRGFLVAVIFFAGAFAVLTVGYYSEPGAMNWYKAARQNVHVSLSVASLCGVGLIWLKSRTLDPWVKKHGLIVTLYFSFYALVSFVKTGKGEAVKWYMADSLFSIGVCICIWLWLSLTVPKLPKAPVKLGNAII